MSVVSRYHDYSDSEPLKASCIRTNNLGAGDRVRVFDIDTILKIADIVDKFSYGGHVIDGIIIYDHMIKILSEQSVLQVSIVDGNTFYDSRNGIWWPVRIIESILK